MACIITDTTEINFMILTIPTASVSQKMMKGGKKQVKLWVAWNNIPKMYLMRIIRNVHTVTQNETTLRMDACLRIRFLAFTQERKMVSENKVWPSPSSRIEVLTVEINVSEEPLPQSPYIYSYGAGSRCLWNVGTYLSHPRDGQFNIDF
jgi:hypothetical protein